MSVAESIDVKKFITLLKTFVPEFNKVPDSALESQIKDPRSHMPISFCNVLELSVSDKSGIPVETYGCKVSRVKDRIILSIDMNGSTDNLIRYAQSNKIKNTSIISKLLKTATEEGEKIHIPENSYLEYEPGIWVLVVEKEQEHLVRLPGTCRFEVGDDHIAIMFSENKQSYKINNPKPERCKRKSVEDDDISWDILFTISEAFTKYLYHLPVEHFAINENGKFLEVYVKMSTSCIPPKHIPEDWVIIEANDTIFKFRHIPKVSISEQIRQAIACLVY